MSTVDHITEPDATPGLSRRQALARGGAASAALLLAVSGKGLLSAADADAATAACTTLTPEKEIGPYFVEEKLNRSDVTTDPTTGVAVAGVPLTLSLTLLNEDASCAPFAGAQVDIWHADPSGKYSDESSEGTSGKKDLRGYQVSDAGGKVTFKTVYPGWYSGRAVHIHARIRTFDSAGKATYDFLGQLFFDDAITDTVYKVAPYSSRGTRDTKDATDRVYGSDGATCLLTLTGDTTSGYTGAFTFGLSASGATTGTSTGTSTTPSTGTTTGTTTTPSTGTTSTDTSVTVSLPYVTWHRTATGRRQLRIKVRTAETTKVVARVLRGSKTLKRTAATSVPKGTHGYTLSLPKATAAGRATLEITVEDAAGNTKTLTRIVHVPKKAS